MDTRFEAVSGIEGNSRLTLPELAFRFFLSVSLSKTPYLVGIVAFPANAGYLLRHADDSLSPPPRNSP